MGSHVRGCDVCLDIRPKCGIQNLGEAPTRATYAMFAQILGLITAFMIRVNLQVLDLSRA